MGEGAGELVGLQVSRRPAAPADSLGLTGANTYTGGTLLNNGTLSLGNNNAAGTGTITVPPPTPPMTRFPVTTRSPPTLSLPPPLPYSPMAPTRSPADPPMEVPVTMGPTDLVLARLMQNQQQ